MPTPLVLMLLQALGTCAGPDLRVETDGVDAITLRDGLEARLGPESLDGWRIRVGPGAVAGAVEIQLVAPNGREDGRSFVLSGTTSQARGRDLASALALVIEQQPRAEAVQAPPPASDPATPPAVRLRGWLAVGGAVGGSFRSDVDLATGPTLRGGAWALQEHLQPVASISWGHSAREGVSLDGFRFGGGVAAGGAVGQRPWLGVQAVPHAVLVRARESTAQRHWAGLLELMVLVQVRVGRGVLVGLRFGLELLLPPIRAVGEGADLAWPLLRWGGGLELGGVLGPRRPRAGTRGARRVQPPGVR